MQLFHDLNHFTNFNFYVELKHKLESFDYIYVLYIDWQTYFIPHLFIYSAG